MEHTEWEEQTEPHPNSPLSPGPSQPVKARTKYSFTGHKYLTDASMHGAAHSPLRQLYKHSQGHAKDQAPQHDGMHRLSPGKGSAETNGSATQVSDDTHGSSHALSSGFADGDQQNCCEEEDHSLQEHSNRQAQVSGHSQDCDADECGEDRQHQRGKQHQRPEQQQHCRFKIIDFGHADLEPVEGHQDPGLIKTK